MEPREAARLYGPLDIVTKNMSSANLELAFEQAALDIGFKESIGSEMIEAMEEGQGSVCKFVLRVARMQRAKEKYLSELGASRFEAALAVYQWGIYPALFKLSASLYVLRKSTQ